MMDDTYTKVHNSILEALYASRYSGTQMAVILYVLRKTYGWNKPSDRISITKMAKETGYTRRCVVNVVCDLEKMGVLNVLRSRNGVPHEMQLNPIDYWDKPVNSGSHVNSDAHVNSDSHQPVNGDSQGGVNSGSQVPVNGDSHTKEIYKDTFKEKLRKGSALPQGNADDDDDGEDPLEALKKWKEEQARNGTV